MQGFLTRIVERRMRRLTLATTIGMALISTTAVAAGRFHDPRFDETDLAIEKAQILLTAAACGNEGEKTTVECFKYVKRAEDLLAKARETVNAAALAADGL